MIFFVHDATHEFKFMSLASPLFVLSSICPKHRRRRCHGHCVARKNERVRSRYREVLNDSTGIRVMARVSVNKME